MDAKGWRRCLRTEEGLPRDEAAVTEAKEKVETLTKEAAAKAKDAGNAVYDLKAVSPNEKPVVDTRRPEELFDTIEAEGKDIADALVVLKKA